MNDRDLEAVIMFAIFIGVVIGYAWRMIQMGGI